MALIVLNGPIFQQNTWLSDPVDCTDGSLVRITMPAYWTPANLTFQLSTDGQLYNDLLDMNGQEIMIPVVPGTTIVIPTSSPFLRAIQFFKFRSGSRLFPVMQTARREFRVAIDPYQGGPRSEPQL
jgi:hypothetical protein